MKKAEQLAMNDQVLNSLDFYCCECVNAGAHIRISGDKAFMFDIKSAKTGKVIGKGLISYGVFVAVCIDGAVYDFLRYVYCYTATSAQHIAKFAKLNKATKVLHYKPV